MKFIPLLIFILCFSCTNEIQNTDLSDESQETGLIEFIDCFPSSKADHIIVDPELALKSNQLDQVIPKVYYKKLLSKELLSDDYVHPKPLNKVQLSEDVYLLLYYVLDEMYTEAYYMLYNAASNKPLAQEKCGLFWGDAGDVVNHSARIEIQNGKFEVHEKYEECHAFWPENEEDEYFQCYDSIHQTRFEYDNDQGIFSWKEYKQVDYLKPDFTQIEETSLNTDLLFGIWKNTALTDQQSFWLTPDAYFDVQENKNFHYYLVQNQLTVYTPTLPLEYTIVKCTQDSLVLSSPSGDQQNNLYFIHGE